MKIYLICPVRGITEQEEQEVASYVNDIESQGHIVHYPPRDVDQSDPIGDKICNAHARAMLECDEVHIFWNGSSFDFGMAFILNKPIKLIRHYDTKTDSNMLRQPVRRHRTRSMASGTCMSNRISKF